MDNEKLKVKINFKNVQGSGQLPKMAIFSYFKKGYIPDEIDGKGGFSWLLENDRNLADKLTREATYDELNHFFIKAVQTNDVKGTKYLISKGAAIHYSEDLAICYSAYLGYEEMTKFLIEVGASVNAQDGYPIQAASEKGFTEIVTTLCEADADVTKFDNYAIKKANENKYYDIVAILEKYGAELD